MGRGFDGKSAFEPQRHRDTEKTRRDRQALATGLSLLVFSVSLCLCGSDAVSGVDFLPREDRAGLVAVFGRFEEHADRVERVEAAQDRGLVVEVELRAAVHLEIPDL